MAGSEHVPLEVGGQVGGFVTIEPVVGTDAAGRLVPGRVNTDDNWTGLTDLEHQTAPDHGRSLVEPASPRPGRNRVG